MSELSSLLCKVKITKPQLEKFLNSPLEEPQLNKNWLEWWNSRKMYSKMELTPELLRTYHDDCNEEVIEGWIDYREAMAFSDYDESTEIWHWGMMFFSQNFTEMLPMFAFIISLEKFVTESEENMAIVFPFFWGDDAVHAYITFENGKGILSTEAQILKDINPKVIEMTKKYLNEKWEELAKEMNIDSLD
ncbi:hypothetical protein ASE21_08400 [Flavobacterium sp. Root901]|uniref:hypothetical protein n=1 Tax=Flavobacterium sp. Root901 TaxID=1736605 RepID=UPI00070B0ED4|nr:hypothetical protein [Flavobacterium sp. Root901]KRD11710.1 hypothetical protein ASE21_08400 [Flavobacterium sp. Root901]